MVCILWVCFVWIIEYICGILFFWIRFLIVGIFIIILWVVILFLFIFLSRVCEIIVCKDFDNIECIIDFFFVGNILMIWLMVLGVEFVCKVLNIRWLVLVVDIVNCMVFKLCNLFINIILGFLCNVECNVLLNEWVFLWIFCWFIRFNLFLCINLMGFLMVKICFFFCVFIWLIIVVSVVFLFEFVVLVISIMFVGWLIIDLKILGVFSFFKVNILFGIVCNIVVVFLFCINVFIWNCDNFCILKEKFVLRFFLYFFFCLLFMILYISLWICLWLRVGILSFFILLFIWIIGGKFVDKCKFEVLFLILKVKSLVIFIIIF